MSMNGENQMTSKAFLRHGDYFEKRYVLGKLLDAISYTKFVPEVEHNLRPF